MLPWKSGLGAESGKVMAGGVSSISRKERTDSNSRTRLYWNPLRLRIWLPIWAVHEMAATSEPAVVISWVIIQMPIAVMEPRMMELNE